MGIYFTPAYHTSVSQAVSKLLQEELQMASLTYLWCILCIATSSQGVPIGSGSGSGSGRNFFMPPVISNCPMMYVSTTMSRPVSADLQVMFTGSDLPRAISPDNLNITFFANISQVRVMPASVNNVSILPNISTMGDSLTIVVVGDIMSITSVMIDIAIVAMDTMGLSSMPCEFTIMIYLTNSTLGNFSGSGSGNGFFRPPVINYCPMRNINTTFPRPISADLETQVIFTGSDLPNASSPDNLDIMFFETIAQTRLMPISVGSRSKNIRSNISTMGDTLTFVVIGDFVSVTAIEIDIAIVAVDSMGLSSMACNFTVVIYLMTPTGCTIQATELPQELLNIQSQLQPINAVSFVLNIPLADLTNEHLTQFASILANEATNICAADCGSCFMSSTCTDYLQNCQRFSIINIPVVNEPTGRVTSKRAVTVNNNFTVIDIVITHPNGAPLSGILPLVPLSTVVSIANQALPVFQNATGITVLSFGPSVTNLNFFLTEFFAQIVLPIFITLFVLILVIGIIIICVIGYWRKSKNKTKVLPMGSNSSQSGLLGRGK